METRVLLGPKCNRLKRLIKVILGEAEGVSDGMVDSVSHVLSYFIELSDDGLDELVHCFRLEPWQFVREEIEILVQQLHKKEHVTWVRQTYVGDVLTASQTLEH